MLKRPIYLDYNATTPVEERVLARMLPYFRDQFGNASSSSHPFGWAAAEAVLQARESLASFLGAEPREILFTGGATEALNTALKGVAAAYVRKGRHIVTVATEHKAVLDSTQALARQGYTVTYLPVRPSGLVDVNQVEAALTDETILVSVMWANNETGVLQPIAEIAERVRRRGILFMTDATQALGKVPVCVDHVDLLACSAHKIYGPKGVGALYVRRRNPRVRLVQFMDGGGQEEGLRGGTLNVPGIVGLGAAAEVAQTEQAADAVRWRALRDQFEASLRDIVPDIHVNGGSAPRLPQTTNITFRSVKAAPLMLALRDLAVSTGSACATGSEKPSHVLKALGLSDDDVASSIRFSLGRPTTEEEMRYAADYISDAVARLRREVEISGVAGGC